METTNSPHPSPDPARPAVSALTNRRSFFRTGLAAGAGALFVARFAPAAGGLSNGVASPTPFPSKIAWRKFPKTVADVFAPLPAGSVTFGGWFGGRMDACMNRRVMARNIERLVATTAVSRRGLCAGRLEACVWELPPTDAIFRTSRPGTATAN